MLQPNMILQNRYQVIRPLDAGGMGTVYLALHLGLNQYVALKENSLTDPAAATQFQVEANILARLAHPNLPRVTDFFVEPSGMRYLVMDYIEGQNLETIVQQHGALPEQEALAWLRQILDAVKYLHANHIIHRDIKPQNIIITPQGKAVLVDFGIAKFSATGTPTMSGARSLGSPGFAPPEQYSGGTDERSDIYSLGATLYFLMTGRAPEDAPKRAAGAGLTSPRQINPSISPNIENVITTAMNLAASQRLTSVGVMDQALSTVSGIVPVPKPKSRTKLWLVGLAGVLALACCVIIAFLAMRLYPPNPGSGAPAATIVVIVPAGPVASSTPVVVVVASPTTPPTVAPTLALSTTPTPTPVQPTAAPPTDTPSPTATPTGPQWSLDVSNGFSVINLATRSRTALPYPGGNIQSAVWTADGRQVLFTWMLQKQVTTVHRTLIYEGGCDAWGCWDPYYDTDENTRTEGYGGSVRLMGRQGENGVDILQGGDWEFFRDAILSPDGQRIATTYKTNDGNQCPFMFGINGSGRQKLNNCEADDHPRFWSVDGKWIIAWSERGVQSQPDFSQFYAYEVDGTRRVPLAQLGKIQMYDEHYYPWKIIDSPVCKSASFWTCE